MNPWRRLAALWQRRRFEREMRAEMEHHLAAQAERFRAQGMAETEARFAAQRVFGNVASVQEQVRDTRAWTALEDLLRDLRLGVRLLAKEPLFSLLGVLAIAGGIGVTTALFSVVNSVVVRPLPFPEPERVVQVWETNPGRGISQFSVSFLNFQDWRQRSRSWAQLAAAEFPASNVLLGDEPERLRTVAHTQDWFGVFGLRVARGRAATEDEFKEGAGGVVVISDRLWRTRFGAAPDVVGRPLALNGASHTIIGIIAPEQGVMEGIDLFIPLAGGGRHANRGAHDVDAYGRLAPGVDLATAEAELQTIAGHLAKEHSASNDGWGVRLEPIRDTLVPASTRRGLWLLLAAVGLLLVIACTNLAGLLLARASGRTREFAVRAALGGGRSRLIRQVLAETMVLVTLGGAIGAGLAAGGVQALRGLGDLGLPRAEEISLDGRVLLFVVLATILTGLFAGLVPALAAGKVNVQRGLKEAASDSAERQRARRWLMGGQLALAVMLLGVAALLLRSYSRLQDTELGFAAGQLVTARFAPGGEGRALTERFIARVQNLPGVEAVAVTNSAPLAPQNTSNSVFPVGAALLPATQSVQSEWRVVSGDYFRAMQIPILRGRVFTPADNDQAPRVAIVNETLARQLWGDEDPVGRQISPGGGTTHVTVIGVVGDVRSRNPAQSPAPQFYLSAYRWVWPVMTLVVRADRPAEVLVPLLRAELRALDPGLPLFEVRTMAQSVDFSLAPRRVSTQLLFLFAGLAVLLTAAGLFAMVAQTVAQRTREVGIRLALGATPRAIVLPLLRDTLRVTAAGLGVGLLGTVGAGLVLRRTWENLPAADPLALIAAGMVIGLVALGASVWPLRRALRVDPLLALRAE